MLPPALLHLVGAVHVFRANGAAIGLAQCIHQLAQGHGVFAEIGIAGVEDRFLIGIAEAVERGLQVRNIFTLCALQGVKVCPACTNVTISSDQLLHRGALAPHFGVCAGQHHAGTACFRTFRKSIDHWQMWHILCIGSVNGRHMLQRIEVIAPGVWDAAWILEVVFVHLFDIGRIATEEVRIAVKGRIDGRTGRLGITHIALTSVSLWETLAG